MEIAVVRAKDETRRFLLAGKSHLVGSDKPETFVKCTAFVGGVKEKAVEALSSRPVDYSFQQESRDAAFTPFRLGKYVYDDAVASPSARADRLRGCGKTRCK